MPIIIGGGGGGGGVGGAATLTFLELQDEVLAHGFAASAYRERVKRWLNEGLHRVQRLVRFPDFGDLVTVAGEGSVDLPSGALRVHSITDPTTRSTLAPLSPDEYDESTLTPGKPGGWMVYQGKVYLDPTPNQAYTFQIRFSMNSVDLVNDNDTFEGLGLPAGLNDYAMVIVEWALSRAYRAEDDAEMSALYMQQFNADLLVLKGDFQMPTDPQKRIIGGRSGGPGPRFSFPGR